MEVHSTNEDFHEEHLISNCESNISKDIAECNDKEMFILNNEKKNEEDLRKIVYDGISNSENNEHEGIHCNQVSDNSIKDSSSDDKIDRNETSEGDEIQNNNRNAVEKALNKLSHLVDSDSEEEINLYETLNKECLPADDHDTKSIKDLQNTKYKKDAKNKNARRIMDSESEDDAQTSNADDLFEAVNNSTHIINTNYQALIDSESEEEKEEIEHKSSTTFGTANVSRIKSTKEKPVKKRKGSIRASKDEAMRQIHSETQRLLRETDISLPYHRPKQHTLQEFLNRKKLSATLPKAPSTAAKLKMSSAIVSQALAEKEKEAELFYKSSDSEDDTQPSALSTYKNEKSCIEINEDMSSINIKNICIQSIQNIETNNSDSHNSKEIIRDNVDPSTPAILFEKDFHKEEYQNKELFPSIKNDSNQDNESDILTQQSTEEYKQKFHKNNVSRKLFDTSSENDATVSDINHHQLKVMKEKIDIIITSLDKENNINEKESESNVINNCISKISKTHQYNSDKTTEVKMIDENRNEKLNVEKMTKKSYPCVNNKQINNIDVASTKSDDDIIVQDDEEKRNKYAEMSNTSSSSSILNINIQSKIQDGFLIEEDEKLDGHVLGLPLPKFTNDILPSKEKSTQLTPSAKVTLKGSPGTIIDLADYVKPKKGVTTLLDRFFNKHVNTNKQSDNESEITVVHLQDTKDGPIPVKKRLPYKLSINNDNPELNKPGAKLMRLKEDLKLQMTLKRNEEWKRKEIELQEEKQDEEYDSLDEHAEAETIESSDSGESEPEENDVYITDKRKSKCLFADDEAEVTDDENSDASAKEEMCNESDIDEAGYYHKQSASIKHGEKEGCMSNNLSEIDSEEEEDKDEDLNTDMEDTNENDIKDNDCKIISRDNKKEKRQLSQEFRDNSNITNLKNMGNENNQSKSMKLKIYHEDNSISEDESNISIFQHHPEVTTRSQICKTPVIKTSMLNLVSPITQLSVLNTTLDSNKKDEFISMESIRSDKSPEYAHSIKNKIISQKRLFDDVGETIDDDYLMQLCSGTFGFTQKTDLNLKNTSSQSNTAKSQLRESCFENINTKLIDIKRLESLEVENENSQDIKLTLDEDFLHNPINHVKESRKVSEMNLGLKLRILSSDDEDQSDEANTFLKSKKRPVKRLDLSDSEEEDAQSSEQENDINDKEAETYVDYDSEENEVIIVPKKDIKKVAANFVEEEAELSESDWDSADEDEKDLNELELEEGDNEHIDEDEVKNQLEKIHRKQILDEDKREVRLLQELLFEDGDLYTDGMGRERKFRWKNIDKLENNTETTQVFDENDGWVDSQEDEEEAQWSKLRHERDKFLEERMKNSNNEIENELYDSQIFKLGLEALKKIKDNESQKQDVSVDKIDLSENMEPITPQNITDLLNAPNTGKKSQTIYNIIKRRSLLTKGEESLARIASLAKQGDPVSHMANARNFVFQYIDPNIDNTSKKNEIEENWDSQNKPRKRKVISNFSSTTKRKRK